MKNIKIAYTLSFLWRSWFWLGVWIFYYLKFTDYAGIGLLEAIMITTATVGEIPTGAIADIFGKKWAVTLAFVLSGAGNLVMAIAPSYWVLVGSIVTMTIGGAFYSGSLEALVYDSLKEKGQTDKYQKTVGRMTSMQNLGMAIAGVVGGFLYQIHASLPFFLVAATYLIGVFVSLGLTEPKIDTEKYSWRKFVSQNKEGFGQLFSSRAIGYMVLLFLIPGWFMIATENVLNDATAMELGFNSVQLGIFASALYLFGVFISEKSDWLITKLRTKLLYGVIVTGYVVTLITVPWATFWIGAGLLLLRYGAQTVFHNYRSTRINEVIDSRYRATTLSTFSLLENIPYVLGATGIGLLMNLYTAKTFSMYFGLALIGLLALVYLLKPVFKK